MEIDVSTIEAVTIRLLNDGHLTVGEESFVKSVRGCASEGQKRILRQITSKYALVFEFAYGVKIPDYSTHVSPVAVKNETVETVEYPTPDGWTLREYQKDGIQKILEVIRKNGGLLVADQMGLGKTIQSLSACTIAQREYGYKIVVLCPRSMKPDWVSLAKKLGIEIEVFTSSHASIPTPFDEPYVLICDEGHYFQDSKSQRTKKFLTLALSKNCVSQIVLTGTPSKNGRAIELFPILKAIGSPLSSDEWDYKKKYCDLKRVYVPGKGLKWDWSGSSNVEELHEAIRPQMLRRLKKDCLKDLKGFQRIFKEIEIEKKEALEYNLKIQEAIETFKARIEKREVSPLSEAIVTMGILRRIGSEYKATQIPKFIEDNFETDEKIVIFSTYLGAVEYLRDYYGDRAVTLTGETSEKDREKAVREFQQGTPRFFLGTVQAGGVGLTLTRASSIILIDRPWTPGETVQAEDRIHRIGQINGCFSYWMQLGSVDLKIDEMLKEKQGVIDCITGDSRKVDPEKMLEIIKSLYKKS